MWRWLPLALFAAEPALAAEFETREWVIDIPNGEPIRLEADTIIEVDEFRLDRDLFLDGYTLRVNATVVLVDKDGRVLGFSPQNIPTAPPDLAAFSSSAGAGRNSRDQTGGLLYSGTAYAGSGERGQDGSPGEVGVTGSQRPGPLIIVSKDLSVEGVVELRGQEGSSGQRGQDGQNGGRGGKGMNAKCSSGSTSASCYAGTMHSGLGGLGGFGGEGGSGGRGGSAVPIIILNYGQLKPGLTGIRSLPGIGGLRGSPGRMGDHGAPGSAGRSCSAKADWGSAFGACSINGGPATTQALTDERAPPVYRTDDRGERGPPANWKKYRFAASFLEQGFSPNAKGVLGLRVQIGDRAKLIRQRALRVELIGRLATTLRRTSQAYSSTPISDRPDFEADWKAALFPTIEQVAMALDTEQIAHLLGDGSNTSLDIRIRATIPHLRDRFISEKDDLLRSCDEMRRQIEGQAGDSATVFFQRLFLWCSAKELTWLPFEQGRTVVTVTTPRPKIPPALRAYAELRVGRMQEPEVSLKDIGVSVVQRSANVGSDRTNESLLRQLTESVTPSGRVTFRLAGDSSSILDDTLALTRGLALMSALDR